MMSATAGKTAKTAQMNTVRRPTEIRVRHHGHSPVMMALAAMTSICVTVSKIVLMALMKIPMSVRLPQIVSSAILKNA